MANNTQKQRQKKAILALRRSDIGLADLVTSLKKLNPQTPVQHQRIRASLGFGVDSYLGASEWQPYRPRQAAISHPRYQRVQAQKKQELPTILKHRMPPVTQPPPSLNTPLKDTTLQSLATVRTSLRMPNFAGIDDISEPPLPRTQLIARSKIRAILSSTVATSAPGPNLDIPRLIESAVRCSFLSDLPFISRTTTSHGCHVLLDFSDAMMPWWEDLRELKAQLQALMGPLCYVYSFKNYPKQATRWTEQGEITWSPVTGVPVIIASDLGVLNFRGLDLRARKDDWQHLTRLCRKRQTPLVALIPLHDSRWPKGLDSWLRLIPWRRTTTATAVKQLQSILDDTP